MRKKLLTVALAATMAVASVFSAFAAETKIENKELAADSYEEMANPLKGKNAEKVTISYTINWNADAPNNGWDGVFSFFDASTNARVSFQTAPYLCYNAKDATGTEDWIDLKADAWCSTNCEAGKDYTFTYVITKDGVTVSCDGTKIDDFKEVGKGDAFTGFQEILDAFNTYPTLTVGVGTAKSSFWNTEPCKISITIDDGVAGGTAAPDDKKDETSTQAPTTAPAGNKDNVTPSKTGDSVAVAVVAIVALGAAVAVVASKKKVTE